MLSRIPAVTDFWPQTIYMINTVPPIIVLFIEIFVRFKSHFKSNDAKQIITVIKTDDKIPPIKPINKFWVQELMRTPIKAAVSIIPSVPMFKSPAFFVIEQASAARRIGVLKRIVENKRLVIVKTVSFFVPHAPFPSFPPSGKSNGT